MSWVLSVAFPNLGVVLSNVLYLAPFPAVHRVRRYGILGDLNTVPLAIMLLSTVSWVGYGLAVPNGYIVASNIVGVPLSMWYVVSVLPLTPPGTYRAMLERLVVGGAALLALEYALLRFLVEEPDRPGVMGFCATVICCFLFASPLSTIAEVLREGDSSSILAHLAIAQTCNCGLWTFYGIAVGDIWVWGPNTLGLALGVGQLALRAIYPSGNHEALEMVAFAQSKSSPAAAGRNV